jgi:signal peptidase II
LSAGMNHTVHAAESKGMRYRAHATGDALPKEYDKAFPPSFLIITVLAVLADQLSKTVATHLLLTGESVPVLGNFFRLTLVLNPGGVFGTRLGSQNFYALISLLAIGITLWFFLKSKTRETKFGVGLCLVLGGAMGNVIDRFRFGEVVDFLDFDFLNISLAPKEIAFLKFPGFYLDRWPVFNLADGFVLIGMVLVVIHLLFCRENQTAHPSDDSE